jgi:hypothetical protein
LTTVHHPLIQIGATAATMLLKALDEEALDREPAPEQVVHPTELVVRESTAPPRTAPLSTIDASLNRLSGPDASTVPAETTRIAASIGSVNVKQGPADPPGSMPAGFRFSSPDGSLKPADSGR